MNERAFLISGMMKKLIASILFFTLATPVFSARSTQFPRRVSISIAPVSVASALEPVTLTIAAR